MILQARAISFAAPTVGRLAKWAAAVALASFAAVACSAAPAGDREIRTQSLAQMEKLRRLCGLPQGALTLGKDDHVLLEGSVDKVPFSAFRCALDRADEVGIPRNKIGFVSAPPPATQY